MRIKEAERLWQSKALADMKANMAATQWVIERRPHGKGHSYCVSCYVCRSKTAEYWPAYRGGIRFNNDLQPYGKEFLATETLQGNPL